MNVALTSQENRALDPGIFSKNGILQRKCNCGQNTFVSITKDLFKHDDSKLL